MTLHHTPTTPTKPTHTAFTLLEVILALSLLALLSGMVFGIVRVSMRAAFDTQHIQQENDQITHFIKLCRQTFQNLPAAAIITLEITQTGIPAQQELTLSGVPECFAFGSNPLSYEDTIIGQRPDLRTINQPQSSQSPTNTTPYFIGISRQDLINTDGTGNTTAIQVSADSLAAPDQQGRYWMPLLTNVTSLTWRFYNSTEDTWEEEWDSAALPELVEMNLLMLNRTTPIRMVYAIPTTKLADANPALAPRNQTTTTNNNANTTNNNPNTSGAANNQNNTPNNNNNNRGGGNRNQNQPNNNNRTTPPQPTGTNRG